MVWMTPISIEVFSGEMLIRLSDVHRTGSGNTQPGWPDSQ